MKKLWLPLLLAVSFLIFYLNFTKLGAVLDTRMESFVLAMLCSAWAGVRILRTGSPLSYAIGAVSLVLLWMSIRENFLLYEEHTIVFSNQGAQLEGTLYTPRNGTDCLVLFLQDSGPEDRRKTAFHARRLARYGVAGFAYDKRGSGRSSGNTFEVGFGGYARDAVSALDQIQAGHFYSHVGLFGFGEAEWVSIIINEMRPVDFIVMVSASGLSPLKKAHRELMYSLERQAVDSISLSRADSLYWDMLTFDNDSTRGIALQQRIEAVKHEPWFRQNEKLAAELSFSPWWYEVMGFDPTALLSKLNTPVLVLVEQDEYTLPYEEIVENFSPFADIEVKGFKKGDNSLLEWQLGEEALSPSFTPGFLTVYTEWIQRQCQHTAPASMQ